MKTKTKYVAALFSMLGMSFLATSSGDLGMPLVVHKVFTILTCVSLGFTLFYMTKETQEK